MTYGGASTSTIMEPFWEAANEGRLVIQHCPRCDHQHFPPTAVCPNCLNDDLQWRQASGRGRLESVVEFHRAYWDEYRDDLPYNVCLVRLSEGPLLISNLVGDPAEARLGAEVCVLFEAGRDKKILPKFRVK